MFVGQIVDMRIADAHRDDGKRFVVRADEKLTAFLALRIGDSRLPNFGCEIFALRGVQFLKASPNRQRSGKRYLWIEIG